MNCKSLLDAKGSAAGLDAPVDTFCSRTWSREGR